MSSDRSPQSVVARPPVGGPRAWRRLPHRPGLRPALRALGWPRLRRSIRTRVALLALALGLPFIAYVAGTAVQQATIERETAKQHALSLAKLFAARLDDYVGDVVATLGLVKQGVTASESRTAANDAYLRHVWDELPQSIHNIGVWTLDGRNVGALVRGDAGDARSIADQPYFRDAIATGQVVVAGPLPSTWNREPIVVFARPIYDAAGATAGVITISAALTDLHWLLDLQNTAPPGTVVSILTPAGDVLARNIEADRYVGTNVIGVGNVRANIARREGVDDAPSADDLPRIAGFTQALRVPWHVFVGLPEDAALASARRNVTQTLAFGALSLFLGALFAVHVGSRIAKPLRQLAHDATVLARGHFDHRSDVEGEDETGVLARTLNRLAQTVEERTSALQEKAVALEEKTTALEARTAELATITANVPVLIAYIDADERLRFVNEYLQNVFHVAPAHVLGRKLCEITGRKVYARLEGRLREARAGMPQTFETTFTSSGSGPIYLVSCFPDYGDAQEVRGSYVVCQDITRRKHAEESLAMRERFIRLIADGIPARITYIDRDARVRFGNRRFAEYWNADPETIVGRPLAEVVPPGVYAQIAPELERSYAGERSRFDLVVEDADETQYYQVDHVPDVDAQGQVQGVFTISQDVTALRRVQQALAESEKRMRMVADNLPALIAYLDDGLVYRFVNARATHMFGMPHEALLGRTVESVLPAEAYAQSKPHLMRALGGERARFQRSVVRHGEQHHELVELIPDQDANGKVLGLYALVQDVTDVRAAQAKAEASEERLQRITDSIPSMVGYIDRDRRYRFNSRYYETWLGKPLSEITGQRVADVLGAATYASVGPNLDRAFAGERIDFEVEVRHAGTCRFLRGSYIPDVDAAGRVIGVYTSSTDVTPMKEVERQLACLAQKDTLTGLPNRHAFNDRIAAALARSARSNTQVALMFLDIDAFKTINDTLGHAGGDDVLREFARRLQASVRPTDLVARLAGDEFVIVLEGMHTRDECRFVARKIIAAMRPAFRAGDASLRVTTSIGIAMSHGGATTAEALLKRADSALYAAKGHGRDTFEIAI